MSGDEVELALGDFSAGYTLGYAAGYDTGYAHGVKDESAAWASVLGGCTETWRRPRYAELEERRKLRYEPCTARCGSCSRCVFFEAWQRRGGRPFLGVEREAELARGVA